MPSIESSTSRKRLLIDDAGSSFGSVSTSRGYAMADPGIAEFARLVTTNKAGRRDGLLQSDETLANGDNFLEVCGIGAQAHRDDSTYVIEDPVVSNIHCKLYAVLSTTGGVIVSCHDLSTNGVMVNGFRVHKSAAIVMDGDEIEILNARVFKCIHVRKEPREKLGIFEPTPPQSVYKNLKVGYYTISSHCLGSGSFASVHLAFDASSSSQVACKTIINKTKGKTGKNEMHNVMREVEILRGLKHANINGILHVEKNEGAGWLHIFLELCTGGDLFTYTLHRSRLNEAEAKFITFQLFKGIEYLHSLHVSHRDLKPENILLHAPGPFPRVQIADFGLARERAHQKTLNVCGTVSYLPPEGIMALDNRDLGYVGMPADCWSIGVIIFIMLSGNHPFDWLEAPDEQGIRDSQHSSSRLSQFSQGNLVSEEVVKARIIKSDAEFTNIWDVMPDARTLVEGLLVKEPARRTIIQRALQSQWIYKDLEKLLHDYNERIDT